MEVHFHLESMLEIKFLHPPCKYGYDSPFNHPAAGDALSHAVAKTERPKHALLRVRTFHGHLLQDKESILDITTTT